MPDESRQNTITIGGILLQRDSGGFTIVDPVAQYGNIRDDQLQFFWHWFSENENLQKAIDEFEAKVSAELIALGDSFVAEPKE